MVSKILKSYQNVSVGVMFEKQPFYFGSTLKTFNMKYIIVPKIFNC